jgi:hypothetical protein
VDEALRLERQVAEAEGTPGPDDPRAWARLLSAARLGSLLDNPEAAGVPAESVSRKLKELGVFNGPMALSILTWEDFSAVLSLVPTEGGKGEKDSSLGEVQTAYPVGLTAVSLSVADLEGVGWVVRWKNDAPGRDVSFLQHTLVWDGKAFKVRLRRGTIGQKVAQVVL